MIFFRNRRVILSLLPVLIIDIFCECESWVAQNEATQEKNSLIVGIDQESTTGRPSLFYKSC